MTFVTEYEKQYGKENMVLNVHTICIYLLVLKNGALSGSTGASLLKEYLDYTHNLFSQQKTLYYPTVFLANFIRDTQLMTKSQYVCTKNV